MRFPKIPLPQEDEVKFHENARDLAIHYMRGYGQRLIRGAISTAKARRHPIVLKKDVEYTAQRLRTSGRHRRHVVFQFLGAGLLGVFIQGFTAEMLSAEPEPWVAVFYVVIGFLGIFAVFWSLIR